METFLVIPSQNLILKEKKTWEHNGDPLPLFLSLSLFLRGHNAFHEPTSAIKTQEIQIFPTAKITRD